MFVIIAISGLATAASAQASETMTVRLGQQKTADKSDLRVGFVKLVSDSRCPATAKCVWAGSAKIKIAVSRLGSAIQTFELNTGVEPRTITVHGYEIKVADLAPYPGLEYKSVGGKLVATPQTATFTITKTRRRTGPTN